MLAPDTLARFVSLRLPLPPSPLSLSLAFSLSSPLSLSEDSLSRSFTLSFSPLSLASPSLLSLLPSLSPFFFFSLSRFPSLCRCECCRVCISLSLPPSAPDGPPSLTAMLPPSLSLSSSFSLSFSLPLFLSLSLSLSFSPLLLSAPSLLCLSPLPFSSPSLHLSLSSSLSLCVYVQVLASGRRQPFASIFSVTQCHLLRLPGVDRHLHALQRVAVGILPTSDARQSADSGRLPSMFQDAPFAHASTWRLSTR